MKGLSIILVALLVSAATFARQGQNPAVKADKVQPAVKEKQQAGVRTETEKREPRDFNKVVPSKSHGGPTGSSQVKKRPVSADPDKVVKSNK